MSATTAPFRAGVSSGDVTPRPGVELGGYPYFDRANTGVHDPLHAGVLYLADPEGGQVLLVVTDLFWLTRPQADSVRAAASEASGVPADRIVVTCSHTHSAPWTSVVFEAFPGQQPFETRVDPDYLADVSATLARLASEAVASAFEAEVGYARIRCGAESGVGGNRREPVGGPVDDDLPVLLVRDGGGAVRALWTKYAVHPTILHGENTLVSADFPGAMRAVVAEAFPEAVFLYSMGTAGDQSPRYFRSGQTCDEVERFGSTLGRAVVGAARQASWDARPRLAMATRAVDLAVKDYPEPEALAGRVADLRRREVELIAAGASYTERQTANLWLLGAECDYHNAVQRADGRLARRYEASAPYEVTGLVVGEAAWVFLPGEVFCAFGLDIKERSPYPETHVVTLANGDLPGYCVTREALEIGGYEPGNSILDPASGDILADAAVGVLNEIKEG